MLIILCNNVCFINVINVLKCLTMHKSHYNYICRFFFITYGFYEFCIAILQKSFNKISIIFFILYNIVEINKN